MSLKVRLAIMNFFEFAVWGAYLTSMGNYLGTAGLGDKISWFYAIQGIVSLFMPTLMGVIADKYIQPQRILGICHFLAGLFMMSCWWLGYDAGYGYEIQNKSAFIVLYTLSVAFYMPTLALSNTVVFTILINNGYDTIKVFPPIRVLGTVGFIVMMWFVNCAVWENDSFTLTMTENAHKFQYTYMQFFVSGILSFVLYLYCFTLPKCNLLKCNNKISWGERFGLNAFKLFKQRQMGLFFIFSALLGMCLQITNGFAGPFITSFKGSHDVAISTSFAANNATLLTSISQISEALCIMMIPFFMKRWNIKVIILISLFAWVFRFGFFGIGSPVMPGVVFFILSCIIYGVAFDFFNVSGGLFVYRECDNEIKASAQGLFMMMTNGLGATIGTLAAGSIVNYYCKWRGSYLVGDWQSCWFIFSAFAFVIAILFSVLFKPENK